MQWRISISQGGGEADMAYPIPCCHNSLLRRLETHGFIRVLGVVHRVRCQAPVGGFLPGTTNMVSYPP